MKRIFYNWINRWNERLYGIVQQVRKGDGKQDRENGSFGCFFCNAELLFFNRLFHSSRVLVKIMAIRLRTGMFYFLFPEKRSDKKIGHARCAVHPCTVPLLNFW